MLEWSQPTTVALVHTIQHLKREYKLFGSLSEGGGSSREERKVGEKNTHWQFSQLLRELPPVDVDFRLTDINAFLYGLVPGMASICYAYMYSVSSSY